MSPEHRFELERRQGPPHINKGKQYETVLPFKVSFYSVYSAIKTNNLFECV